MKTNDACWVPTKNGEEQPPIPEMAEDLGYDPVSHPKHYTSGKYEVINIIEDQLGIEGLRGFALGNSLKYIMRAKKKDPAKECEDLKKAIWYLNHYIERMKVENE